MCDLYCSWGLLFHAAGLQAICCVYLLLLMLFHVVPKGVKCRKPAPLGCMMITVNVKKITFAFEGCYHSKMILPQTKAVCLYSGL